MTTGRINQVNNYISLQPGETYAGPAVKQDAPKSFNQ